MKYKSRVGKVPEEAELWELIKIMVETSTILVKYGIYLDFDLKNIQVSAVKKKQIYWGHARENHSHRQFYRMTFGNKINRDEGLSPE